MSTTSELRGAAPEWRLILGTGSADEAQRADGTPRESRSGAMAGTADAVASARGAVNMAVDEALLESVQHGGPPVLRFYTWQPACLSLGRNQPARNLYDTDRAAAAGIDIVRRPTGGLAVLHDRELTYCLLAPLEPFGGPRAAYAAINRALIEGLRAFGIAAEQATDVRTRGRLHPPTEPCFQEPAAGEVVVHGRKLVGSAQRCERGALLQHGSILLSGSQARVRDLLVRPVAETSSADRSITLQDLIGRQPSVADLVAAMCRGFERMFGTRLAPGQLDQRESARAQQLAGRYEAGHWTWRR
jgi:lipoyl(octanoyl) transferase